MITPLIKAVFAGVKKAKREAQKERKDNLSHWRYRDLITTPYLHPTDYLFGLAKDANKRKNIHDLLAVETHLYRHRAFEGTFSEILRYVTKAVKRLEKAS